MSIGPPKYSLVVFTEVMAASALVSAGVFQPLVLLARLSNGRLLEIDLDPNGKGIELSEAEHDLLPRSSSALVIVESDLEALDVGMVRWEHVIHPLGETGQSRSRRW